MNGRAGTDDARPNYALFPSKEQMRTFCEAYVDGSCAEKLKTESSEIVRYQKLMADLDDFHSCGSLVLGIVGDQPGAR